MNCRYCHDGEDTEKMQARISELETALFAARDIIHDNVTHEAQTANAEAMTKIAAALKPACGDMSPSFRRCIRYKDHCGAHMDASGETRWADAGGFA